MRYLTPGPTQIHPVAEIAIKQAFEEQIVCQSHRGGIFADVYANTVRHVRAVMEAPDDWYVFFLGSATEAMERLTQNCVERTSAHLINGAFGEKFYDNAKKIVPNALAIETAWGESQNVHSEEIPNDVELISLVQNETSTGVWCPQENIETLRERFPKALIALDVVSAAPIAKLDYSKIDAAFFSVQKGFGLPSGLGVLLVSERCLEKSETLRANGISTGSFHSFDSLLKNAEKYSTPETPNILNIYTLGIVAESIVVNGLDTLRENTRTRAEKMYAYLQEDHSLEPFVKNPLLHSPTTVTVMAPHGAKHLIEHIQTVNKITVGDGYPPRKDEYIRIANFTMHTDEDFEKVIEALRTYQ